MKTPIQYIAPLLILLANLTFASAQRFVFEYKVSVELPQADSTINLWVPYPRETRFQKIEDAKIVSALPWKMTEEKRFGNRMIFIEGKSKQPFEATFTYVISRKESRGISKAEINQKSYDRPEQYLKEDSKVPFIPLFREIAAKETSATQTEDQKIRSLYGYIVRTMSYDKSGKGWGNGDAIWACSSKRGNCTDFHSLFIGLSRVSSIPARFIIGFPIPKDRTEGDISGYHCWAEAFSSSSGWIPIDASEAKKSGDPNAYYGLLPPDRVEFTMGRDLILEPKQKAEPLNYFIYPYAEVDGKMVTSIGRQFRFRKLAGESEPSTPRLQTRAEYRVPLWKSPTE